MQLREPAETAYERVMHEVAVGDSFAVRVDITGTIEVADLAKGFNRMIEELEHRNALTRQGERLTLESELRGACARGEIFVHYQSEYELGSSRLVRFEALARWRHSLLGEIPPARFIPVAEESGLIHQLGEFVMEEACKEAVRWQSLSPHPIQLAVNVSAIQFNSDSAAADIAAILRRTGLRPELLQIELTESVMLGPVQVSAEKLRELGDLGIALALDDFGTGYSSLSYLAELPFDSLKIDLSFVRNLFTSSEALTLVRSLIGLARNMHMTVIVEGIEERAQLELLRDLGATKVRVIF